MKDKLSREEYCRLLLLAKAIVDYGLMMPNRPIRHSHLAVVDEADLSFRLREPVQDVIGALLLLQEMGRAQRLKTPQSWKIDLADGTMELTESDKSPPPPHVRELLESLTVQTPGVKLDGSRPMVDTNSILR